MHRNSSHCRRQTEHSALVIDRDANWQIVMEALVSHAEIARLTPTHPLIKHKKISSAHMFRKRSLFCLARWPNLLLDNFLWWIRFIISPSFFDGPDDEDVLMVYDVCLDDAKIKMWTRQWDVAHSQASRHLVPVCVWLFLSPSRSIDDARLMMETI